MSASEKDEDEDERRRGGRCGEKGDGTDELKMMRMAVDEDDWRCDEGGGWRNTVLGMRRGDPVIGWQGLQARPLARPTKHHLASGKSED